MLLGFGSGELRAQPKPQVAAVQQISRAWAGVHLFLVGGGKAGLFIGKTYPDCTLSKRRTSNDAACVCEEVLLL